MSTRWKWKVVETLEDTIAGFFSLQPNDRAVKVVFDFEEEEFVAEEICKALTDDRCTLLALEFASAKPLSESTSHAIVLSLATNRTLKHLSFGKSLMSDSTFATVVEILKESNSTLVECPLRRNRTSMSPALRADLTHYLERNMLLKSAIEWSSKTYKWITSKRNFCSMLISLFYLRNITPETHRELLIDLFAKQRQDSRAANSPTFVDNFLKISFTTSISDYTTIACWLKQLNVIKEEKIRAFSGITFYQVVLQQIGNDQKEVLSCFYKLSEVFNPDIVLPHLKDTSKDTLPIMSALSQALGRNVISPKTCAQMIEFLVKECNIVTDSQIFHSSLQKVLVHAIASKYHLDYPEISGNHVEDWLSSLEYLLLIGDKLYDLTCIHEALVKVILAKQVKSEALAQVLLLLSSNDCNPSVVPRKDELMKAVLDAGYRGVGLFSLLKVMLQSGYSVDFENIGNNSALDYILCGPPRCKFSQFGVSNSSKLNRKTKQVRDEMRAIRRERRSLNNKRRDSRYSIVSTEITTLIASSRRSGASPVQLLKNMFTEMETPENIVPEKQKKRRKSWVSPDYNENRKKIQQKLNLVHTDLNSEDLSAENLENRIPFDSVAYVDLVLFLKDKEYLSTLNHKLEQGENKSILEVVFKKCETKDSGIFQAVKTLFEAGFDLEVCDACDDIELPGRYLLKLVLNCKCILPEVLKAFFDWIPTLGFGFDGTTSDRRSVLEHVLKQDYPLKSLDGVLKVVFESDVVDISYRNEDNEGLFDWMVFRTKKPSRIAPAFIHSRIAKTLRILAQYRDLSNVINSPLVDGRTILQFAIESYSRLHFVGSLLKKNLEAEQDEQVLDAVKAILNSGYDPDQHNLKDETTIDFVKNSLEKKRISPHFAVRLFQCLFDDSSFRFQKEDIRKSTEFLQVYFQSIRENTAQDLAILSDIQMPQLTSSKTIEMFVGGEVSDCSVTGLVNSFVTLKKIGVDIKAFEDKFLEKLFYLRSFSDSGQFLQAIIDCCGENSVLGLNLDSVDETGRVFRSRLENDDSEEIRMYARQYEAFDDRYREEPGAPVHQSETCTVVFAMDVNTQLKVALKKMVNRESAVVEFEVRKELLATKKKGYDKYVMELLVDSSETLSKQYLVMPRADRSLFDVINTERIAGRDFDRIHSIMMQAMKALKFLNVHGFSHGDFKPRNFMRTSFASDKWKLIDLDCCVKHGTPHRLKASSGYAPPEMARKLFLDPSEELIADSSYDIWSFGVVLFELVAGIPLFLRDQSDDALFTSESKASLINWISLTSVHSEDVLLKHVSKEKHIRLRRTAAFHLISKCLASKPSRRISFKEILRHPFLARDPGVFKKKATKNLHKAGGVSERQRFTFGLRLSELPSMDFPEENHLFLSYNQKEGSEIVRSVSYGLNHVGCSAWLDMRAKRVTEVGMLKGVLNSRAYMMVLTENVLFRPFCVKELLWAIHHRKKIFFLYEVDSRFHPFSLTSFWLRWRGEKLKHDDQNFNTLLQSIGKVSGFAPNGALDFDRARESGGDVTEFILRNDLEEYLKKHLKEEKMIPYRRREYENKAMMSAILQRAGFVTTSELESRKKQRTKLMIPRKYQIIVLRDQHGGDSDFCTDIIDSLFTNFDLDRTQVVSVDPTRNGQKYSVELNDLLKTAREGNSYIIGVIALMTPGFFKNQGSSLESIFLKGNSTDLMVPKRNRENFKLLDRSIIAIQNGWFAQEQSDMEKERSFANEKVYELILTHSEVMAWRSPDVREYENEAMRKELTLRLTESFERMAHAMAKFDPESRRFLESRRASSSGSLQKIF